MHDADRAFVARCKISVMAVMLALFTCCVADGSCYAYTRLSQAVTEARLKKLDETRPMAAWWRRVELLAYYDRMSHSRSKGAFGGCLPATN
jgi:hypothetical protein